jgi:hypothetical protein
MAVSILPFRKTPKPYEAPSVVQNPLAGMLSAGGAIAGGILGGMATGGAGALQGAAAGSALGGTVGGMVAPPTIKPGSQAEPQTQAQPVSLGQDVLSRKLEKLNESDSNLSQIAASIDSLKYIQDDDLKYKLAQPLLKAYQSGQSMEA